MSNERGHRLLMSRWTRLARTSMVALAALLTLAACDYLPIGYTAIADISSQPVAFEGKEIKIRGEVVEVTKIPLLDIRAYRLRDASGEITVVTQAPLPARGEKIAVKGIVESALIVAGQSFGMSLRESKRLNTPWT